MSVRDEERIGELIAEIAARHRGKAIYTVMMGTVVPGSVVQGTNNYCSVQMVGDAADNVVGGVLLNGRLDQGLGVLSVPADNSKVWIAQLQGSGMWGIVKTTEVVKWVVTVGDIDTQLYMDANRAKMFCQIGGGGSVETNSDGVKLNNGSIGGVPRGDYLVNRLNLIEADINTLKTQMGVVLAAIDAAVVASPGSPVTNVALQGFFINFGSWELDALVETVRGDIENTEVVQ